MSSPALTGRKPPAPSDAPVSPAGAIAWWPAEIFYSAEAGFPGPIDITGPARNMAHGPYQVLAPGLWQAELRFDVCPDAARHDYVIDLGAGQDFTSCIVRAAGPGGQAAVLRHRFAADAHAEVRLWLGRPAFHGALQLRGAKLTLLAP